MPPKYNARALHQKDRKLRDRFIVERKKCVYLVKDQFNREFVVLRPDAIDISRFLQELVTIPSEDSVVDRNMVRKLLNASGMRKFSVLCC